MVEAITATYAEHDDDWSVTVTGRGEELTERAPGIIAARDQADQLIESLKPEDGDGEAVVVHLLNGSALEFTTAYMTARLSRTTDPAAAAVSLEQPDNGNSGKQSEGAASDEAGHQIPAQATAHEDEQPRATDDTGDDASGNETDDSAEPAASSAK